MIPAVYFQDLVGLPYKARGRTLEGLDCFGVILLVLERQGLYVPDPYIGVPLTYGKDGEPEDSDEILTALFGDWSKVEPSQGTVVAFSRHGKRPDHAGYMIDNRLFIHAVKNFGKETGEVVISNLNRDPYKNWFVGAYAYVG